MRVAQPLRTGSGALQSTWLGWPAPRQAWRMLGYATMAVAVVLVGLPMYWMFIAAFKTNQEIFTSPPTPAMKFMAFTTGADTIFWSQNTGYMPVRNAALQSAEMKIFFESHPNFKTTVDQLPKTRPQDSARELVPNGDQIIGKGLERITANGEAAEAVFKDVADQLNTEKAPVLRALKELGEA
jgi:ABC-type glycerol-3-phosphate transport system substrate-binding protein